MRNDFQPIHLQEANAMLQRHCDIIRTSKKKNTNKKEEVLESPSFWNKVIKTFSN